MLSKFKFLKIKLFRITSRCSSMDDVKASKCYVSREGVKVLESIQSSTTPDLGYLMGK